MVIQRSYIPSPYRGSNPVSSMIRRIMDATPVKQVVGIHLAGIAFLFAIVLPQTGELKANLELMQKPIDNTEEAVIQPPLYQWPLAHFGLSQGFSFFHPGLDMTADEGTYIRPVADGTVLWVNSMPFGYGNHLLIGHRKGIASLYAHLSTIAVTPGEKVTKQTVIGSVGSTGQSTGYHLHLEIYQDFVPANPIEVLPNIPLKVNPIQSPYPFL